MRQLALACVSILASVLPLQAKDAVAPPISIKSAEVKRLDTIRNYTAEDSLVCCAMEVLESGPDHDFVYLHILLDVAWSEEIDRISYYGGDAIRLKLPGQTDPETYIAPWGTMDWYPEVRVTLPSINESRDRKWPEVDNDTYLEALFTVPSGVNEATLVIGKKDDPKTELAVDLSGEVTEFEPAGSLWDIDIKGIEAVESIATERDIRGGGLLSSRIAPGMGQLVKIDMAMTPKRDLKADRLNDMNAASFVTKHVWLVGPEGLPLALVGEARENQGRLSLTGSSSSTTNWKGEGTTGEVKRTFYFLGSGAPGDYQLYFKDMNVGTVALK